jgi:hypothetical protein
MKNKEYGQTLAKNLSQFLISKKFSDCFYAKVKIPGEIGLLNQNIIPSGDSFESEAPDGYLLGNEEMLAAVGSPAIIAETVYDYYVRDSKRNMEWMELNNHPSRMSVLVGPRKKGDHLRLLFTEIKFQDFLIEYKINGKQRVVPCWKFENQIHYRIEKTRITVATLFNKEIKIHIIDYVLKSENHKDLPVMSRNVLVENISTDPQATITEIKLGIMLGNVGQNWNVVAHEEFCRFEISPNKNFIEQNKTAKAPFWSILVGGNTTLQDIEMIKLEEITDFEDLDDFVKQNSVKLAKSLDENVAEPQNQNPNSWSRVGFGFLRVNLGDLSPLEKIAQDISVVVAKDRTNFESTISLLTDNHYIESVDSEGKNLKHLNNSQMLENTYNEWYKWSETVPIHIDNPRLYSLIDAIQTMLRCIVSDRSLHIGTLYYGHDSAFVRDNFWCQDAFLKAGRFDYAARDVDFFYKAWQNDGFRNSYSISSQQGSISNSKEMRVEIPVYTSLMTKNLYYWSGDDSYLEKYFPMIKDATDESLLTENNLCIINSDETWIWPVFINEHDYYIDNSLIGLTGYNFALKIAEKLKKEEEITNWREKRDKTLNGIIDNYMVPEQYRFALGIDNNQFQDTSLIPTLISRPILLNIDRYLDPFVFKSMGISAKHAVYNGLALAWETMKSTGVIRSHTKTTAIEGNTPGNYLYACSELDMPFLDELYEIVMNFPNATGSVNEIHDLYNRKWGTEKQRTWDSSSLLSGLLHYLYGMVPFIDHVEFNPHLPPNTQKSNIGNFPIHGFKFGVLTAKQHNGIIRKIAINNKKVLATTFQGKILIFDKEIDGPSKSLACQIQIFNPFNRSTPDSEKKSLVNIKKSDGNWGIDFDGDNLSRLKLGTYILHAPEHQISMVINILTDFKAEFLNKSTTAIKIAFKKSETSPYSIDLQPNELKNVELKKPTADESNYPFCKDSQVKPYWLPPSFILNLDSILFSSIKGGVNSTIIICDEASLSHAREIYSAISIVKRIFPLIVKVSDSDLIATCEKHINQGRSVILSTKMNIEKELGSLNFNKIHEIKTSFPKACCGIYSMSSNPDDLNLQNINQMVIYVPNNGHCYTDTHPICELMGTYLMPLRSKAMSSFPHGIFRLSDIIGDEINEKLPIDIKIQGNTNTPLKLFIQGIPQTDISANFSGEIDTAISVKGYKPGESYLSIAAYNKFVPMELAAPGIAKGNAAMKLKVDALCDAPIKVKIKIDLPQNFRAISLGGEQRERILDPLTIQKNADGSRTLNLTIHPGKPVHKYLVKKSVDSKLRSMDLYFGKFPRFND